MKADKAARRSAWVPPPDMKQNAGFLANKRLDREKNMHYYA
jgi:hypothetical protein